MKWRPNQFLERYKYLASREKLDRRTKPAVKSPKRKRETNPPEQQVFHTTVRLSPLEVSPKETSELALYSLGLFYWETGILTLEDYMRMEFLLTRLLGSKKDFTQLKDKRKQDICVLLSLVLRFGERSFEPLREYLGVERLLQMSVAKVGMTETLSRRAHGARSDVWAPRYELWLELRTEGEADTGIRGKRYSSYTKGYHDGSSLRPKSSAKAQVLDRLGYDQVANYSAPNLEIWDPEEFRKNL
jgi:hypothetical protein